MERAEVKIIREYGPFPDAPRVGGVTHDGEHVWFASGERLNASNPESGRVVATIPAPEGGASDMIRAEGMLPVGQHRARKIHPIDPRDGTIMRTLESNRFVTGVTRLDGEVWHATWEDDESDSRRIDPRTGDVLESLKMPEGVNVSGLDAGGRGRFCCGGGESGKVRAVRVTRKREQKPRHR